MARQPGPSLFAILSHSRASAILLMVLGAVGFMAALVFYQGRVLFLFGSTVLVFLGLWWNIRARRAGYDDSQGEQITLPAASAVERQSDPEDRWLGPSLSMPRLSMARPPASPPAASLTNTLLGILQSRNASAVVDAQHQGRSILRVKAASGAAVTIMVIDGTEPVSVSELRGLVAMRSEHHSKRAILVSGSSFTQQAISWAHQHDIQLLDADQLPQVEL